MAVRCGEEAKIGTNTEQDEERLRTPKTLESHPRGIVQSKFKEHVKSRMSEHSKHASLRQKRSSKPVMFSKWRKTTSMVSKRRTFLHDDSREAVLMRDMGKGTTEITEEAEKPGAVDHKGIEWAKKCSRNGLRPLLKEFGTIRKFTPKNATTELFNKNLSKNRYNDVSCLDSTRVILKGRTKDNDYIHANWVELPSHRKYICTQAPVNDTVEDFWLMILQVKATAIIMLCDTVEMGKEKCSEYFPLSNGEGKQYGDIEVKNERAEKGIDTMEFHVMNVQMGAESHSLTHIRWDGWPDRLSPISPLPVLNLLARMRSLSERGPIVVHCSAGIGRTGTYCALDYATDRLNEASMLSIPKVIKEIRNQRLHSVQSMLQYLYLHVCILEYLVSIKATARTPQMRKFQREYELYLQRAKQKNDIK